MNKFIIVCLLVFGVLIANAQIGPVSFVYSISGKMIDEKNDPIYGANIILLNADSSSALNGASTDITGKFLIERVKKGKPYLLKIVFLGYNPIFKSIPITESSINLGTIAMVPNSKILKQVEVEGKVPVATQNGDTTSYNANAYKVNKDANAEDLVTKMPGVNVVDGKVQAQGEDVKQVLVDGKVFFGDDASAVLKNLPAEVVDKIQVFDKKSDQAQLTGFDDGNSTKTINIVTKPQFRNGVFGKFYAGYGIDDKYKTGLVYNKFNNNRRITILAQTNNVNEQNFSSEDLVGVASSNSAGGGGGRSRGAGRGGMGGPGGQGGSSADNFLMNTANGINKPTSLGINYSDKWGKKTEVSGSYFGNQTRNTAIASLHQQYVSGSTAGLTYTENSSSGFTNSNHRINLKIETKFDSMNSIVFQPKLSFQTNEGSKDLFGENILNLLTLSSTTNKTTSNLYGYNISAPLLYRHSFAKRGRTLSVNANPTITKNSGNSTLFTRNQYGIDTSVIIDTIDQRATILKDGIGVNGNIMYTEPLNKFSFILLSYNTSITQNNSSKRTYERSLNGNEYNQLDSLYTNVFSSNYQTQSGGIGYRYQKEKYNFGINAAYQWALLSKAQEIPTSFSMSKNFISFLPSAQFQYKFTAQKNLRVFYRSSNNAPSIDQLQDVINNSNSLQLSTGNPQLKQDYQHNLNVRYQAVNTKKANSFFALLGGNYALNYIGNSVIIASKDTTVYNQIFLARGSQIQRPENLNGYYSLRSFVNYTFPISKIKTNISLNASINYNCIPGLINNQKNFANTTSSSGGVVLSSNISEKIDFTISSNSSYSTTTNSLQSAANTNYFSQNSRFKITYSPTKSLVFQSDYSNLFYRGLTSTYNQNISLWNAAVGYKFLKNKQAEVRITVYDLLNQNSSISRTNTESYTQDLQTNVLNRYYLATFTYNFRKYAAPKGNAPAEKKPKAK